MRNQMVDIILFVSRGKRQKRIEIQKNDSKTFQRTLTFFRKVINYQKKNKIACLKPISGQYYFYTPWKRLKTRGLMRFSVGTEIENWSKMD